jgi:hypothetical protein
LPQVTLTNEAHELVRSTADSSYLETGIQLPGGCWSIPLEQTTIDRVMEHALPGDSISSVIIRIFRDSLGMKPN